MCSCVTIWTIVNLSDFGVTRVVLVKSFLHIGLDLPLQLYKDINTPSGTIMTRFMHRLVSSEQFPSYLYSSQTTLPVAVQQHVLASKVYIQ